MPLCSVLLACIINPVISTTGRCFPPARSLWLQWHTLVFPRLVEQTWLSRSGYHPRPSPGQLFLLEQVPSVGPHYGQNPKQTYYLHTEGEEQWGVKAKVEWWPRVLWDQGETAGSANGTMLGAGWGWGSQGQSLWPQMSAGGYETTNTPLLISSHSHVFTPIFGQGRQHSIRLHAH